MGDVEEWLAEALRKEREDIECKHKAILAELGNRLAACKGGGEGAALLPGQAEVDTTPVFPANAAGCEKVVPVERQVSPAVSETQGISEGDLTEKPRDDDSSNDSGEDVSMQLFKKMVKAGPSKGLRKFVNSVQFELFFGFLIIFNTLIMGLKVQFSGVELGYDLTYPRYDKPAEKAWPGAKEAWDFFGYFFGVLFTIELVLKIFGLWREFLWDKWNWFDTAIVVAWYIELFEVVNLPIDSSVIRIFRLARLLRLLRLVKKASGFESLYLMVTAMRGSGSILLWAVCMLGAIQVFCALALNQVLTMSYFEKDGTSGMSAEELDEQRHRVFKYFGTFSRSLLSCFEMTVGNWVPIARCLVEDVSEWFMIVSLAHKMMIGYAMIGIINGVFIQETFKVAATDDLLMLQRKAQAKANFGKKMGRLFKAAGGTTGTDSSITKKQFKKTVKEPYVKNWLSAMEFDVRDADAVFNLVDTSHDGEVSLVELRDSISKLKGPAKSLDLALVASKQAVMEAKLAQLLPYTPEAQAKRNSTPAPDGPQSAK